MTTDTTATPESGATTSTAAEAAGATTAEAGGEFWKSEAAKAFAKRDALAAELRQYREAEKAKQAEAEKRAAEAGEFRDLYEKAKAELEAVMAERDQYAPAYQSAQERIAAKMEALSEEDRALVADLPLHKQAALIEKLTQQPPPSVPRTHAPGNGNGGPPPPGTPERVAWMRSAPWEEVRAAHDAEHAMRLGRK